MPAALVVRGLQKRYGPVEALAGVDLEVGEGELASKIDLFGRRDLRGFLEELRTRGVSGLMNTVLLSDTDIVCDRVAILLRGRIVSEGDPAELARARGVEVETDQGKELFPVA